MDLTARYDCIIHTENLMADMRKCLKKYLQQVHDQSLRDALSQKIDRVLAFHHHANAAKHGKCAEYFDAETTSFVWERERAFASKLGYSKCCGGIV